MAKTNNINDTSAPPRDNRRFFLTKLSPSVSPVDLKKSLTFDTLTKLPHLEAGKVRVKIHYAALNFADVLLVQGKYQEKPTLPTTFGSECSGVVVETTNNNNDDDNDKKLSVGQPVMVVCTTNTGSGAFADHIDAFPWQLFPIPTVPSSNMTLPIAAGFAVAAGTAHIGLVDRANIRAGDLVVVTGASGGTGLYACLIAKAYGCRVVATARGSTKVKFVKSLLGIDDVVIDFASTTTATKNKQQQQQQQSSSSSSPEEQLLRAVLRINKMGAQVIYDTVGEKKLFRALLKCAKWKCRICIVGFASGNIPKVPSNILLVKNSSVVGVYWGSYFINEQKTVLQSLQTLFKMADSGQLDLTKVPTKEFMWRLDDLPFALAALATGKTHGKVLLKCGNSPMERGDLVTNDRSKL